MSDALESHLETLANENAFLQKYFSLRKKCEQLQQANEKIVNRIHHVKKLIKRYKRERRYLANRLDEHGDSYRDVQVPVMWEEDQMYKALRPNQPIKKESDSSELPTSSINDTRSAASVLSSINPVLVARGIAELKSQGAQGAFKGKKVKTERDKDPNAPKKPANVFLMYCQQQRASVQEEYYKEHNEEISNHELTRRIALRWNVLTHDQKKVYYDMYEQEKEKYERELKQYQDRESSKTSELSKSKDCDTTVAMGLEAQSAVDALMMDN